MLNWRRDAASSSSSQLYIKAVEGLELDVCGFSLCKNTRVLALENIAQIYGDHQLNLPAIFPVHALTLPLDPRCQYLESLFPSSASLLKRNVPLTSSATPRKKSLVLNAAIETLGHFTLSLHQAQAPQKRCAACLLPASLQRNHARQRSICHPGASQLLLVLWVRDTHRLQIQLGGSGA
ncbi:hypothetical protein MMC14_008091 [Varicellaria rhodocarpa]|nr:hypothetical protein [Varicellaria rhodocarpa]